MMSTVGILDNDQSLLPVRALAARKVFLRRRDPTGYRRLLLDLIERLLRTDVARWKYLKGVMT